jgi:hypothetical protein
MLSTELGLSAPVSTPEEMDSLLEYVKHHMTLQQQTVNKWQIRKELVDGSWGIVLSNRWTKIIFQAVMGDTQQQQQNMIHISGNGGGAQCVAAVQHFLQTWTINYDTRVQKRILARPPLPIVEEVGPNKKKKRKLNKKLHKKECVWLTKTAYDEIFQEMCTDALQHAKRATQELKVDAGLRLVSDSQAKRMEWASVKRFLVLILILDLFFLFCLLLYFEKKNRFPPFSTIVPTKKLSSIF